MTWRKLALYLIFLLVMVAFYFYQHAKLERIRESREKAKLIYTVDTEEIKKVKLKNEYGTFTLKKQKDKWQLTKPITDWAEDWTVSELLDTITKIKADQKISPLPQDISPYGLDRPRIEVSLYTKAKTFFLQLGSDTPDGAHVYALTGDKQAIYLLGSSLVWTLNKKLEDLRDKRIFDFDPARVIKVAIKRENINIILKKEKNLWELKSPFTAKADKDEVEDLLYRLQTERIKSFQEVKFTPELSVEIWQTGVQKPIWLKLKKEKGRLIGRSNYHPTSFILTKDLWQGLAKVPETFKDRHIVHFEKEDIARVEITYGQRHVRARRKGEKWLVEPKDMAEDYEIEFLLADLLNLKYLPKKISPPAFTSAQAEVKLWDKKGQEVLDLSFFKDEQYAWIRFKNKYYPVNQNIWESFPQKMKKEE